ncbi:MAG: hypothetical protein GVY04_04910 [Cyanobacteria bacterium]|nr:hypothetical protein [Cyanobacteria bacterium GSL.Bin1]
MGSKKHSLKELTQLSPPKEEITPEAMKDWGKTVSSLLEKGIALNANNWKDIELAEDSDKAALQDKTLEAISELQTYNMSLNELILNENSESLMLDLVEWGMEPVLALEWTNNLRWVIYFGLRFKKIKSFGKRYLNTLSL